MARLIRCLLAVVALVGVAASKSCHVCGAWEGSISVDIETDDSHTVMRRWDMSKHPPKLIDTHNHGPLSKPHSKDADWDGGLEFVGAMQSHGCWAYSSKCQTISAHWDLGGDSDDCWRFKASVDGHSVELKLTTANCQHMPHTSEAPEPCAPTTTAAVTPPPAQETPSPPVTAPPATTMHCDTPPPATTMCATPATPPPAQETPSPPVTAPPATTMCATPATPPPAQETPSPPVTAPPATTMCATPATPPPAQATPSPPVTAPPATTMHCDTPATPPPAQETPSPPATAPPATTMHCDTPPPPCATDATSSAPEANPTESAQPGPTPTTGASGHPWGHDSAASTVALSGAGAAALLTALAVAWA